MNIGDVQFRISHLDPYELVPKAEKLEYHKAEKIKYCKDEKIIIRLNI